MDDPESNGLDGLPPSAKYVHYALRREGALSQTDLVETTNLSRRTVHSGVSRLVDRGLVRTRPDPEDSRRTLYLALGPGSRGTSALVDPSWVADRHDEFASDDPSFRLMDASRRESETDDSGGVVPGAVPAPVCTEFGRHGAPDGEALARFLGERGVTADTTVVTYSSQFNTCGAYLYWLLRYYGHEDVRLLDGGREAWAREHDLVSDPADPTPRQYPTPERQVEHIRAHREDIEVALETDTVLLDVRGGDEFTGRDTTPPRNEPEPLVPGHIPGTINVEWTRVVGDDRRFRSADDLLELFVDSGVSPVDDVIVYCNVGERAALVWFALSEIVGYDAVSNYDGSYIEWSSQLDSPVVSGEDEGSRAGVDRSARDG
jgi:thiosulfate/3-mercaptopyruvate sulfurtransferase